MHSFLTSGLSASDELPASLELLFGAFSKNF